MTVPVKGACKMYPESIETNISTGQDDFCVGKWNLLDDCRAYLSVCDKSSHRRLDNFLVCTIHCMFSVAFIDKVIMQLSYLLHMYCQNQFYGSKLILINPYHIFLRKLRRNY